MDTSIDTQEDDNDPERILAESALEAQLTATLAAKEHRRRLLLRARAQDPGGERRACSANPQPDAAPRLG